MHELKITEEIVKNIKEISDDKGIDPKIIKIDLGRYSSYKAESILYYYDILKGNLDATLEINETDGNEVIIREMMI